MMELDYAIKENFPLFKAAGILGSLVLILGFQLLFPNRLAIRKLLQNWSVNIPVGLINSGLVSLLCGACVCTWAVIVREHQMGFFELTRFPYWLEVATTLLLLDFVAWIWHRANHGFSLLWRFHAVHHSDTQFDASTAFRFHPGEVVISLGVRLVAVTLSGLPIGGLIAFEVIFGFFNLFVHSDIRIDSAAEGWMSTMIVTPSLHRLHHSRRPRELNSNFGTILSCWDRLASTYSPANAQTDITVGLPNQREPVGLGDGLLQPFRRGTPTDRVR